MSEYFPKPKPLGRNIKVALDLSNYATKADLKNATGADTLNFARKSDLASLKLEIANLDIGQLETTPVDLNKLSDVVKNEVVKKTVYDALVKKLIAIQTTDTSNLLLKADYNTEIAKIKMKILDHDHSKYITTQEFNKLTAENFKIIN